MSQSRSGYSSVVVLLDVEVDVETVVVVVVEVVGIVVVEVVGFSGSQQKSTVLQSSPMIKIGSHFFPVTSELQNFSPSGHCWRVLSEQSQYSVAQQSPTFPSTVSAAAQRSAQTLGFSVVSGS